MGKYSALYEAGKKKLKDLMKNKTKPAAKTTKPAAKTNKGTTKVQPKSSTPTPKKSAQQGVQARGKTQNKKYEVSPKKAIATTGVASTAAYIAGRNSGSDSKPTPKPAPKKATPAPQRAPGSSGYKPTQTDIGPNMNQVNKRPGAGLKIDMDKFRRKTEEASTKKAGPSGPTMTSMGAPSTGPKPTNKDEQVDLKKRGPSKPSMTGFKHGGKVRGDGICKKGKTKGRFI